jgi:phytoene desaturase
MPLSKAVVIGSGVAGLATAVRLAVQGFQVQVYEKNEDPGGKLGYFETEGYCFDTGPSLFTQPADIESLFRLAGEAIEDYLEYQPIPVSCRYFYEDGTAVTAYADPVKLGQELKEKLKEDPVHLQSYLQASAKAYHTVGTVFLEHSLHRFSTWLHAPLLKAFASISFDYLFSSLHRFNQRRFTDKRTVQLFDRYATYNGSDPYRAPGMLSLIPHLEHNEGVFYPKGGMISIVQALYQLALKKGVQFYFNTPVTRIHTSNGLINGIEINHTIIPADIVVSNMDVYFTYRQLLQDEKRARQLLQQERSSSALIFYWGIDREFPGLDLHNIFFSNDYQREFEYLFREEEVYHDPSIYVNITSKYEPGVMAPPGKENWFVMVNAPHNKGQNWKKIAQQCRTSIIAKLSRLLQVDLDSCIVTERISDPLQIEMGTSSYQGALYGTSSNTRMAAFMRHPNFSSRISGLYFAGGSVHPGGGIPLCLKSAAIVSELVQADRKKWSRHVEMDKKA